MKGKDEAVWIEFSQIERKGTFKTLVWDVTAILNGVCLGQIWWSGPWRKYCFHPNAGTVFEEDCLRTIAQFVEARTAEHRRAK